jgi:hypothetical protein
MFYVAVGGLRRPVSRQPRLKPLHRISRAIPISNVEMLSRGVVHGASSSRAAASKTAFGRVPERRLDSVQRPRPDANGNRRAEIVAPVFSWRLFLSRRLARMFATARKRARGVAGTIPAGGEADMDQLLYTISQCCRIMSIGAQSCPSIGVQS